MIAIETLVRHTDASEGIVNGFYTTIRRAILSPTTHSLHEFLRGFRGCEATKRMPIVASERVFTRATFRKLHAGNDLRASRENSPGQNAIILEPGEQLSLAVVRPRDKTRPPADAASMPAASVPRPCRLGKLRRFLVK